MPRASLPALFPFLLGLLFASPALAQSNGDTLTLIWRPLPNIPTFARPTETVRVWANAPAGAGAFAATLRYAGLSVPLDPPTGGWQPTRARWELDFRVPVGTPEELYDLIVDCDATPPDTALHAVRVLAGYPPSFYFAQISDTHLPAHPFSSDTGWNPADTAGVADFAAVIADLNLIRPAFILHSGDFVNEGELEDYLGMHEMGRGQQMIARLQDPMFLVSGNHDIGGWQPTLPPDGTARQNWWRMFGWPFLLSPPPGDPYHSQNISFDFGLLHVVGLEAYINSGSYDHYRQDLWGAQSFTPEQMSWLNLNLAAVPAGHAKLVFYHYDFGGTLPNGSPGPNFSQINPAALGIHGAIWGHNHGVAEGALGARPFNLGLQAVIDGRRVFRIFRVSGATITPGPMHRTGGTASIPTDSLTSAWSGPNDGSRPELSVTITNRYAETWESSRLVFHLVTNDSGYLVTGGTLVQTIRDGAVTHVAVDAVLPAAGTRVVTVAPAAPASAGNGTSFLALGIPAPNPFHTDGSALTIPYTLAADADVEVAIHDLGGRRVARVLSGRSRAGRLSATWDGRDDERRMVPSGLYLVRLRVNGAERSRRLVVVR